MTITECLTEIKSYISDLYISLTYSLPSMSEGNDDDQVTPLATRRTSKQINNNPDGIFLKPPSISNNGTTAETIIYNSWLERIQDEVIPSKKRRYGLRPRGVILRFRNPPEWTKHPRASIIIQEMNYQGLFNKTIDKAYRVHPLVAYIQQCLGYTRIKTNRMIATVHKNAVDAHHTLYITMLNTQETILNILDNNLTKPQLYVILAFTLFLFMIPYLIYTLFSKLIPTTCTST